MSLQFDTANSQLLPRLRVELVAAMLRQQPLTPTIQNAFLHMPREVFVPYFYERDELERKRMAWKQMSPDVMPAHQYLALVYRDDALVTSVDSRGMPDSSSSQPSIMASMIEALAIEPGHRVLEIGTGTGYNAALLAYLTGDADLVTSIDIDPRLVQQARNALSQVGIKGVHTVLGDGYQGYQQNAPYDRVIATASAPTLPPEWYKQLAPGGRLVMELHGSLEGSFFLLDKNKQGMQAVGRFFDRAIHFMPLINRDVITPSLMIHLNERLAQPCRATFELPAGSPLPAILKTRSFRWLLQWSMPGCQLQERSQTSQNSSIIHHFYLCEPETKTLLCFLRREPGGHWQGSIFGSRPLWDDLNNAYALWHQLDCPEVDRYHVEVNEQGQALLSVGAFSFALPQ
ncbi:MAG: methyltransferase domain-containing protein [Ktedonobacteraceae bacterium]|nr:methyltransferase domain-containing protein [Ktedonobacteraceae bacterium]